MSCGNIYRFGDMSRVPFLNSLAACFAFGMFFVAPGRAELLKAQMEAKQWDEVYFNARNLLYRGDFKELERVGTNYLQSRERHTSGIWKFRFVADAVTHPKNMKDPKDWNFVVGRLEEWNKTAKTPFSQSMLGKAYLNHGKNARGDGFASEVPEEQWPKMEERVAKAVEVLLAAKEANPKDPEVYRNLLHAGILQGWPREKMDEMIKEAVAAAPDYYDCHYNMAFYLMERWYGEKGDWQSYANSLPDRIEGEDAYIVYAMLAAEMYLWYQDGFFAENQPDKISWTRMKRGFEAMMKKYPDSGKNLNRFAYFAWLAKDRETTSAQLKILDERDLAFERAWDGKDRLEAARKWIGDKKD